MSETWVDEKGWNRIRGKLYNWEKQVALRRNKKGRAMGGMFIGISKEIIEKGQEIKVGRKGIIEGRVRVGEES